jgi:Protein of unknown function (DUF2283)
LPTGRTPSHGARKHHDRAAGLANYDAENDVLYLHIGEPQGGEGEETPEGHVLRYAPGTNRVVGLTVMGPGRILSRDGR